MRLNEETIKLLKTTKGIHPVSSKVGLDALEKALLQRSSQIMVYHGDPVKIRRSTEELTRAEPTEPAADSNVRTRLPKAALKANQEQLFEKVKSFLVETASSQLKLKDMDIDHDLMQYGFDSISITVFTNKINDYYQLDVMPTIVFELDEPTIRTLTHHLCEKYEESLSIFYHAEFVSRTELPTFEKGASTIHDRASRDFEEEDIPGTNESGLPLRFAYLETKAVGTDTRRGRMDEEPIAIIGMNGIFPQSDNLDEFWENLVSEKTMITEIPKDRFDWEAFDDPRVKWGGFMKEVDKFDAAFFGISAMEAEVMDPQHRLFLQVAWGTIEDAGYKPSDLSGTNTGIFVGIGTQDYAQIMDQHLAEHNPYALTGRTPFMLMNRISSLFNLHGPSEPIDTACSSSLVAVHKAVEAIRNGSCDMAIAGGVNVILTPSVHLFFSAAGMLSDNGQCNVFDKEANGTVRSEGVGAILLKRMSDAITDGDHIYALIPSSAQNHKGKSASLTAPSANAQTDLLVEVYQKANVDPSTITYIEAHSTGSRLGDPIEINGLKQAFSELYSRKGISSETSHCAIGSLKTSIGHLETAAGIGAVIKVLLSLKHEKLISTRGFKELNPYISLDNSPFYINDSVKPWKRIAPDIPRRAGVSAFGFGGVNAHIMIEEFMAPNNERSQHRVDGDNPAMIVLSASNKERLTEQVNQLLAAVDERSFTDEDLPNIAYTLQVGREGLAERLALTAMTIDELRKKLSAFIQQDNSQAVHRGSVNKNDDVMTLLAMEEGMDDIIDAWLKKGEYHKLLSLWVRGLIFDWSRLYSDSKPQRIPLPTYPFERKRYWIPIQDNKGEEKGSQDRWKMKTATIENEAVHKSPKKNQANEGTEASKRDTMVKLLSDLLAVDASEMNINQSVTELGIDSIILTQLLQKIQVMDETVDFETLYNCKTINDLIDVISIPGGRNQEENAQEAGTGTDKLQSNLHEYPELIRLNKAFQQRPVFWFHGGFGGVEVYRLIAQKVQRPFYGIQARGYMTNHEPIEGIEAMASYYVDMIRSIQPEGPYDFGGLSLGGTIAYEVARQMQELGQVVHSITMLESIYVDETMRDYWLSIPTVNLKKDRMLRSINLLLAFSSSEELVLISDHEINIDITDEAFLDQLVELAKEKGSTKSTHQLRQSMIQLEKILDTLDMSTAVYNGLPLADPESVKCYYFCNPAGSLFGENESYFRLVDKGRVYDYRSFSDKWREKLPNLTTLKVEASNHLTLLTEPESQEVITAFCKKLYSDEPITEQYLEALLLD